MTHSTTYVAFPASEQLHELTQGFIDRMRAGSTRPEPETVGRIMTTFVDEALRAFMTRPAELSGISPGLQRVVHFTTETISKATAVVVKSTVKKLDIEQNKRIAEYMDTVRREFEGLYHVCFPISDELAHTAREGFHLAIEGEHQRALPMMVEYFHALTDIAMKWYFEQPIHLLGFGPIMRKVADMGIATTRRASHGVVDGVIPKLSQEQARVSAEYALSLLRLGPTPT